MLTGLSRVTSRTIKEFSMTNDRSVARRSFAETLARKSVEAAALGTNMQPLDNK